MSGEPIAPSRFLATVFLVLRFVTHPRFLCCVVGKARLLCLKRSRIVYSSILLSSPSFSFRFSQRFPNTSNRIAPQMRTINTAKNSSKYVAIKLPATSRQPYSASILSPSGVALSDILNHNDSKD